MTFLESLTGCRQDPVLELIARYLGTCTQVLSAHPSTVSHTMGGCDELPATVVTAVDRLRP